jgi:hypothetical protein
MILDRKQFCLLIGGVLAAQVSERRGACGVPAGSHAREPAPREDRDGWITLVLTGAPQDRGFQHGYALAVEIDDAIQALQLEITHHHEAWTTYRDAAQHLFWNRLDREYQQEITGIAAGLKARGYSYDVQDVLAYNAHIEIGDYYLPSRQMKHAGIRISRAPSACSAFVATGKQTADGKVVMGHNLWWGYLLGQRWRVILDIRPDTGHRILMDALPGFIHSASDFVVNSAGILITETTIGGFMGFDENGLPEFQRARKAAQYSSSLDDFYQIMTRGNNGGYANTWLLADTKTEEIGKLELGLQNVAFSRSHSGFFYGANYPEDVNLAANECFPGVADSPGCAGRRTRWAHLMADNRGKIDAEAAKRFLGDTYDETQHRTGASSSTLCGRGDLDARDGYSLSGAVNAKVVTSEMATHMRIWARMGFPDGSAFEVKPYLERHPNAAWMAPRLHDSPTQPWTLIESKS